MAPPKRKEEDNAVHEEEGFCLYHRDLVRATEELRDGQQEIKEAIVGNIRGEPGIWFRMDAIKKANEEQMASMARIEKTLCGNGVPGIKQDVQELKEFKETIEAERHEHRRRKWAVMLLLIAQGIILLGLLFPSAVKWLALNL